MNILEITGSSAQGGGPEHLLHLISQIKIPNLFLACPNTAPYYSKFKAILNNNIFNIPERSFSIVKAISLVKYAHQMNINIVHTHGKAASLYGKFLKLFLPIHLVHTPHGIHYKNYSLMMSLLYFGFEKVTNKLNNVIIYVSKSEENTAKNIGLWVGVRSVVIPNGVPNLDEVDTLEKNRIRSKYGIDSSSVVTVSICRLNSQKNYLEICNIAKNIPNIHFLIFGDGEGRFEMESKILDNDIQNITLAGFLQNAKDELSAFDIYLSTSRWEGMPLAVLEAMSSGLPVLASNVPGNCDIVQHGNNGYLYELGDIDQASFYLAELSGKVSLREKMGASGKKNQRRHYSLLRMVSDTHNLYKTLISRD